MAFVGGQRVLLLSWLLMPLVALSSNAPTRSPIGKKQDRILAPVLPEVFVHEEKEECGLFFGLEWAFGFQECYDLFLRKGWKSMGTDEFTRTSKCPDDYSANNVGCFGSRDTLFCVYRRGRGCCTAASYYPSWEGLRGNACDATVYNDVERKCSFSLCETLPVGWTTETTNESHDAPGFCPPSYEWVEADELDCDDPCPNLASCDACIDANCIWHLTNQKCLPNCEGELCLGAPTSELGISSTQLCREFEQVQGDNLFCEAISAICQVCLQSELPSDNSKTCRWVDDCSGDGKSSCGDCFASSCTRSCNQVDNCVRLPSEAPSDQTMRPTTPPTTDEPTLPSSASPPTTGSSSVTATDLCIFLILVSIQWQL